MNSKDNKLSPNGAEASSKPSVAGESSVNFPLAEMKRAAAKKLIERYYYQLTDGCGNTNCTNEFCTSSGKIEVASADQAAAKALYLFQNKAKLCERNPAKVAKVPSHESEQWPGDISLTHSTPMMTDDVSMDRLSSSLSPSTLAEDMLPTSNAMDTSESSDKVSSDTFYPDLVLQEPSASTSQSTKKLGKQDAPLFLTENRLKETISICLEEKTYSLLKCTLGQVYSDSEGLMRSFRLERTAPPQQLDTLSKEAIRAIEEDQDKDLDSKEERTNEKPVVSLKLDEITVDLGSLRRAYAAMFSLPDVSEFQGALVNALFILYSNAEQDLRYRNVYEQDVNYLNIFLIVLEIPILGNDDFLETVLPVFCKAASCLPVSGQAKLVRVLVKHNAHRLKYFLDVAHQLITSRVITGQLKPEYVINDDEGVTSATKFMKILFYAAVYGGQLDHAALVAADEAEQDEMDDNLQDLLQAFNRDNKEPKPAKEDPLGQELGVRAIDCRKPLVPFEDFYNEPLNDQIEVDKDFGNYRDADRTRFSFMNYCFILTPASKALGLSYDNRVRMLNERRVSVFHSLVNGEAANPYLRLKVRRDFIIDDALIELEMIAMENPNDLKKQLVVEFEGEQGIDEGGVSKEFFQLVVDELFKPDFGMFTLNPETQMHWFNPTSFETDGQFTLIGIILGLAIYNNVILDVHFPLSVYRKLLGKKGSFEDLADWDPSLFQGLKDLLQYKNEDIEDVFMQTFRISYKDIFGTHLTHDLKQDGDHIRVNHSNKNEFVNLYADFLLNKSIDRQFRAFRRGFQIVTDESPLKWLCRPEEVEALVCGSKIYDFNALEDSAEYDSGFTPNSPVIKYFWQIVHDLSADEKRQLLQFTTGSSRAPVGGLSKLKLIISKNGPDSNRLPTAHTCFNVLLLPEYSSKDKLKERLLKAINYSKGFGML